MTIADYPDDLTAQAHATAISITGVPLLTAPAVLVSQLTQVLVAGAGGQRFPASGYFPVPQIGYEVLLEIQAQAGSTSPFAKLRIQWVDSASGLPVGDEEWIIPAPSSGPYGVVLTGVTKGDQAFVLLQNADTLTQTYSLIFRNNSQAYTADKMRPMFNLQSVTIPGFTVFSDIDMPMGMYGMGSFTTAASGTTPLLIATYNGLMQIKLHVNAGGSGFFTFDAIDPYVTIPNSVLKLNVASPQDAMYTVYLPRVPTVFTFHNTGTTALGWDANLTAGPATVNLAAGRDSTGTAAL